MLHSFYKRVLKALPLGLIIVGLPLLCAATTQGQFQTVSLTEADTRAHEADNAPAQQYVALDRLSNPPSALDRSVTIHLNEVPLNRALEQVSERTDLEFVYGQETVEDGGFVSLNMDGGTAFSALQEILEGTGLELVLSRSGKLVVVEDRTPEPAVERSTLEEFFTAIRDLPTSRLASASLMEPLQGTIQGTVTDAETGETLPGVNVVIQGTNQGASTGPQGQYSISGVEPGTYTLRASFVGYRDNVEQGVTVTEGETTMINFELQAQATGLDEVVVVGYGQQQRQDLTGSVSSISVEGLESLQPQSVDEALQGQVAGVRVTQSSNAPGGGISVRIRGNSSITAGSEPLYVIDGIPIYNDNDELNPVGASTDTPSPNALSFLSPNDIQSIEVLKDASAKAIYGARGSNGVVMIETKSGRSGETRVDFSSTVGVKVPGKTIDLLSAAEHAQMSNEIVQITEQTDEVYWENPQALGQGTDWQDLIYQNAISQNYSLSVGGGGETTTYYVSGNWSDGESIVKTTDTERYSIRASVESDPTDYLQVGGNVTASRVNNKLAQLEGGARNATTVATAALQMWPQFPARFESGVCPLMDVHNVSSVDNQIDGAFSGGGRNTENPICGLEGTNDRYLQDRGLATLYAQLAPFEGTSLEGLTIETRGSADIAQVRRQAFFDRSTRTGGLGTGGNAQAGNVERTSLNLDILPRYSPTFLPDWQSLDVTSGFSWNREIIEGRGMSNTDFPTDVTGFNDIGAGAQSGGPGAYSYKSQSTMVSGFGRVNYQLFGKYLFTGTFRGDGSSRFGVNNRWGLFPSAAVGWRLSEESFVPEVFSNLKLRASWGKSGNQEIGTYDQYSSFGNAQYNFDGGLVGGLAPSGLGNPNIAWEETTEWNVGLDAGFLDGRVTTTIEGFFQDTQELLLAVDLPPATGFGSATQNVGGLENMGIEASVGTNFLFGDFQWRQQVNVSHVQNEVTSLGPNEIIFGGTINGDGGFGGGENGNAVIPGEPIGVFWGYTTDGLLRSEQEVQNHTGTNADGETVLLQPNAVPGDRRWIDTNGDGDITQADKHVIGDPNPDITFGWTNTFRYESVSLDVFLQGQLGGDLYNVTRQEIAGASTGHNTFRARYEDAWTENNRDAEWPRIATPPGQGTIVSTPKGPLLDVWLEDASYLRAESITLTWNLADQFTIPTVRRASLFVGVQNAFTITGYSGVDPDINTEGQDNIRRGVDLGALPLSRNYQFGIRLGL